MRRRQEFLTDLHRRLAEQQDGAEQQLPKLNATRRNVIVGTSAAAAAAVAAVSIDRALIESGGQIADGGYGRELTPNTGRWVRVAAARTCRAASCGPSMSAPSSGSFVVSTASPKPCPGCALIRAADCGSTRRTTGCGAPCHSTSFSPVGKVLTHQLPIAPKPLPTLMVRERDGAIEVFSFRHRRTSPPDDV